MRPGTRELLNHKLNKKPLNCRAKPNFAFMEISISATIREKCPHLRLGVLHMQVKTAPGSEHLWEEISQTIVQQEQVPLEDIRALPPIAASRAAYRALGKEPSRYRLSAEALHRRVVQGKGLYRISNVVDIINLVSLQTAFSIGGYDAQHIAGPVSLSLGQADDLYEAIGRGQLNIENLPVFRDAQGAFGSPTSDSMRTRITLQTVEVLLIFLDFESDQSLPEALLLGQDLLERYAAGKLLQQNILV